MTLHQAVHTPKFIHITYHKTMDNLNLADRLWSLSFWLWCSDFNIIYD